MSISSCQSVDEIKSVHVCGHSGLTDCCSAHMYIQQNVYEQDDGANIDIEIVARRLPHELLVKIYNDYFRPHKFAQLYQSLTINTICVPLKIYLNYMSGFKNHLSIFMHSPIKQYICKIDPVFQNVINMVENRGYQSVFTLIPSVTTSIFIELIMYKYH